MSLLIYNKKKIKQRIKTQKRHCEVPYFVSFHSLDCEDVDPAAEVIMTALQDLATFLCEFYTLLLGGGSSYT